MNCCCLVAKLLIQCYNCISLCKGWNQHMKELLEYIRKREFQKIFIEATNNIWIQLFRYGFVGGIAFVADAGCLFGLECAGLSYLVAAAFAFIVGLLVNFILSKCLVFKGSETKSSTGTEFIVFLITGIIGLGLTELLMYLFTEQLSFYFMISKIM